jgi:hypothetical protein
MVPAGFMNFFLAMAGADAALLGLLFVAVSISPERTFGHGAAPERQGVAVNAFTALIVAFFVSMSALLPGNNVGGTSVFTAAVGLFTSARLGIQLVRFHVRSHSRTQPHLRTQPLWLRLLRALVIVIGSLVLYGYLFAASAQLLRQPNDVHAVAAVAALVMVCCGLGLFRAWELLGAPRQGVMSWLNPLHDSDEPAMPAAEAPSMPVDAGVPVAQPAPDGTHPQT